MFNALAASSQELKNSAWTGVLDKSTGRKREAGKIYTDAGTGSGTSGRIKAIEYTDLKCL